MKKKILVGVLAASAALGLASCDEETVVVTDLTISGQDTEFVVGETFDDGDLVVTAAYSDGTTADVTANATITQNADMSTPGSYAVLVSYEGKVVAYQIVVQTPQNVETLKGVEVYTNDVKTSYTVGETFSTEGLKVFETYGNTTTTDTVKTGDLSGYTVKVLNTNEEEVTSLEAVGTYTVVVSKGELSDSYEIKVSAQNCESVSSAIEVAYENSDKVSSGTINYNNAGYSYDYAYAFGDNYTSVATTSWGTTITSHYTLNEDDSILCIQEVEGELSLNEYATSKEMYGPDLQGVLYYSYETYGLEQLLSDLYTLANTEEVTDLVEKVNYCSVCGDVESYSFSFTAAMSEYTYRCNVEFTLGDNNTLKSLDLDMDGYYLEGDTEVAIYRNLSGVQVSEEKTAKNPYNLDELFFQSFDLKDYLGEDLVDNTVNAKSGQTVYLSLANLTPETASLGVDPITVEAVDADGNPTWSVYGGVELGSVYLVSYSTGTYTVTISSKNVTKTITLVVTEPELEYFAAGTLDWGWLYEATEARVDVNSELIFGACVNKGADDSCTAALETPSDDVTIVFDGEYYIFTATKAGTYTVVLTSKANPSFTANLVVTVVGGSEEETDSGYVGVWENSYTNPRTGVTYESTITFNADGSGTYNLENGAYMGTFAWVEADGAVTISSLFATNGSDITLEFAYDDYMSAYFAIAQTADYMLYHSQEYTKQSTGGESTDSSLVLGENTVSCDWMGTDYTFVATEAGTYTVQASMADAYLMAGTSPTGTVEFTLEAGESYTFTVCDNNNDGSALIMISKA